MAKISGKNVYVSFAGTALGDSLRNVQIAQSQETADATAGADSFRNYVATVKTVEVTAEAVMKDYGNGGSALRSLLAVGSEGTLIIGVEGTAAGKPKFGFLARINQADEAVPYDDVVTISLTWEMAGTALAFNGTTSKFP